MAALKQRGDLAELAVASDVLRRGHKVAIPFGEDWDFDLVVLRHGRLERVQVKHTRSDGRVVFVRCYAVSVTNGRVCNTKQYTSATIDWLAVYDATTETCFYVPSRLLGDGRRSISLRLVPARSGRRRGIHDAVDFLQF